MAQAHGQFDKELPPDAEPFAVGKWTPEATDIMGDVVFMAGKSFCPQATGCVVTPSEGSRPPWDMVIQGYDGPISFSKALYTLSGRDRGALEAEVMNYLGFVAQRFVNPNWPLWMKDAVTDCLRNHVNFRFGLTSQTIYRNHIAPYVAMKPKVTGLPNFVAIQALRCAILGRISPHAQRAFDRHNLGWLLDPRAQFDDNDSWTVLDPDGTAHKFGNFYLRSIGSRGNTSRRIPVRPPPTYITRPDGQVWLRQAEAGRLTFMSSDYQRRCCRDRHDVHGDEDDNAHIVRAITHPITLSNVPSRRAKQVASTGRAGSELPRPQGFSVHTLTE